jgi:hypothetical protein
MAVVAVCSELVSSEFPDLQGKYWEIFNFSLFSGQQQDYFSVFSVGYYIFPKLRNRELVQRFREDDSQLINPKMSKHNPSRQFYTPFSGDYQFAMNRFVRRRTLGGKKVKSRSPVHPGSFHLN